LRGSRWGLLNLRKRRQHIVNNLLAQNVERPQAQKLHQARSKVTHNRKLPGRAEAHKSAANNVAHLNLS
jgi:hypothetical protein